ncbi:MAG: hypothetical protein MJ130_07455 [Lachnospiraceae bacterium]|nr:hypothetical protein [Lachnospiraceae bacterium]
MFSKIGEFFFFIFALFASIFDMATSGKDYHVYTTEERIEMVEENLDDYEALSEYVLEYTTDGAALDSVFIYDIERNTGVKFPEIDKMINDRICVYNKNGNTYIKYDYISGTEGYSSSGVYYTEEEIYMTPASGTECVYDEDTDKHICYFNASSVEVYKITDHWYFYQTAYYDDAGFSRE